MFDGHCGLDTGCSIHWAPCTSAIHSDAPYPPDGGPCASLHGFRGTELGAMDGYDVVVVGCGIVGLATGLALQERDPHLRLVFVDKEPEIARHQSGHNSGVIHSGIYYRPGSLKARLCVDGARRMRSFCEEHGVAYELCGKVIVATEEHELSRLAELEQRGVANGVVGVQRLTPEGLSQIEPAARGIAALHVPHTGIVDYVAVAQAMAANLVRHGAAFRLGERVVGFRPVAGGVTVLTSADPISTQFVVNCAGLHADQVAQMAGLTPAVRIIPFRGEYFLLRPERANLVRGLIYPVPDPQLPFLGVHFTRRIGGGVECGPNAVLAFAREGYTWGHVVPGEILQTMLYRGFWRITGRYWRSGLYEIYRSLNRRAFAESLTRLVPGIQTSDLIQSAAGVRAQAVSQEGILVDDFVIQESEAGVHVLNAPSPAATAALSIGDRLADIAWARLA